MPSKISTNSRLRAYKTLWHTGEDNCCFYCGERLSRSTRTLDHIQPQSRGGTHEPHNLVLCCVPCNQLKGDMLLHEFVDFVASYGGLHRMKQNLQFYIRKRLKCNL